VPRYSAAALPHFRQHKLHHYLEIAVLDNRLASIEDKLLLPESLQSPVGADARQKSASGAFKFNA
jgi:hypothetical protein